MTDHPIPIEDTDRLRQPLVEWLNELNPGLALNEIVQGARALATTKKRAKFLHEEFTGHPNAPKYLKGFRRFEAFAALHLLGRAKQIADKVDEADHIDIRRSNLLDLANAFFETPTTMTEALHSLLWDARFKASSEYLEPDGPRFLARDMVRKFSSDLFLMTHGGMIGVLWKKVDNALKGELWRTVNYDS